MREMNFGVVDGNDKLIAYCDSFICAFQMAQTNPEYSIIHWYKPECQSTPRQRAAVHFIKAVLQIPFEYDIKSKRDCSWFIQTYLEIAKQQANELNAEFEG